ncbi:MAG TPA: hypothetical protein VMB72_09425 [Acidimicrobiales bacterium]|nr:hypothetical protein [Acidimicrobiales bacterium]
MSETLQAHLSRDAGSLRAVQDFCQLVVDAATTGPELADAAALVVATGQLGHVEALREQVIGRMTHLRTEVAKAPLAEARSLAEALTLLG